uniref:ATP synthase subunit a n=1 Tax=Cerophytidae sp. BMNH 900085 TaxID=1903808 RepID=A0A343A4I7_9COLE|nr:ATP synthase F0 subunit 6 [Cerophytidae sp. BMNH 900085]
MMTTLFSSFDPSSFLNIQLNWMMILMIFIFPLNFWFIPSRLIIMWAKIFKFIEKEYSLILINKTSILLISLFYSIFFLNFMSLFPYIFSISSHLLFSVSMALPFWLSLMLYGWLCKSFNMFTHLLPQGTPMILMPFMVFIETISNIIRPLTLSIRLMANMIAGHLLLILLGNSIHFNSMMLISIMIFLQILMFSLELAVSFIQGYVFSILISMYSSEIN